MGPFVSGRFGEPRIHSLHSDRVGFDTEPLEVFDGIFRDVTDKHFRRFVLLFGRGY
jgi:hypothetical protein